MTRLIFYLTNVNTYVYTEIQKEMPYVCYKGV